MRSHKSILVLLFILSLLLGITPGCYKARNWFEVDFLKNFYPEEKKVDKKKFTLMYKPKFYAGHPISEMRLHPVKLSEEQIIQQMQTLKYKEFSLFGKKKPVFNHSEISGMANLIKNSLHHAPKNKIIFYALETPNGPTEGIVFASSDNLNWKFFSIQGLVYSKYPRGILGKWKLIPGSGQKYHIHRKKTASETLENWIEVALPKRNRITSSYLQTKGEQHKLEAQYLLNKK